MITFTQMLACASLSYIGAACHSDKNDVLVYRSHYLRCTCLLTCLTYPLPACTHAMRAHLHTLMHMPRLHHDIAHTFIHAHLFIYTCRFSFIHSCCQPQAHMRAHKFQCRPSQYYYYTQIRNHALMHNEHLRT